MFCRKCGTKLEEDCKVCTSCNFDFSDNAAEAVPAVEINISEILENPAVAIAVQESKEKAPLLKKGKKLKVSLLALGGVAAVCALLFVCLTVFGSRDMQGVLYIDEDMNLMHNPSLREDDSVEYGSVDHFDDELFHMTTEGILYYFIYDDRSGECSLNKMDLTDKKPKETAMELDDSEYSYNMSNIISAENMTGNANDIIYLNDSDLKYYNEKEDDLSTLEKDVSYAYYDETLDQVVFVTENGESYSRFVLNDDLSSTLVIEHYTRIVTSDVEHISYVKENQLYQYDYATQTETEVYDVEEDEYIAFIDEEYYMESKETKISLYDRVDFDLEYDATIVEPEYPDVEDYAIYNDDEYNYVLSYSQVDDFYASDIMDIFEYATDYGLIICNTQEEADTRLEECLAKNALLYEEYEKAYVLYQQNNDIEAYQEDLEENHITNYSQTIYKNGESFLSDVVEFKSMNGEDIITYKKLNETEKMSISDILETEEFSGFNSIASYVRQYLPEAEYTTYMQIGDAEPVVLEESNMEPFRVYGDTLYMLSNTGHAKGIWSTDLDDGTAFEEVLSITLTEDDIFNGIELMENPVSKELYIKTYGSDDGEGECVYTKQGDTFKLLAEEVLDFIIYQDGSVFITTEKDDDTKILHELVKGELVEISKDISTWNYGFAYTAEGDLFYIEGIKEKDNGDIRGGDLYRRGEDKTKIAQDTVAIINYNPSERVA